MSRRPTLEAKALPNLPDGWRWSDDRCRALSSGTSVSFVGNSMLICTTFVADDFAATFIPPEVILAVMKAGGYSLTS